MADNSDKTYVDPSYLPPHYRQEAAPINYSPPTPEATSASVPSILEEDLFLLTPHVEVSFAETFREPKTSRGFPCMPQVNEFIYSWTHFAIYGTLAMIISPILSIVWAIIFAVFHLAIIWLIQPTIKIFYLYMRVVEMMIRVSVRTTLDPVFKSMGLALNSIKGMFQLADSNLNVRLSTNQVRNV